MRSRRYSVAVPITRRGAGLGNEIRVLGKAYIASQVLRAQLVEQPWWLNERRYAPVMGANVMGPIAARAAQVLLPTIEISRSLLADPWDYEKSMRVLAPTLPRSYVVKHATGMLGGLRAITPAREFLRERLGIQGYRPQDGSIRVGVHVRRGDFGNRGIRPGLFNQALPWSWTLQATIAVVRASDRRAEVSLLTDADDEERLIMLAELKSALPGESVIRGLSLGVLGDLNAITNSDVIIPSVSSFSTTAIFLSEAAYVWPREGLNDIDGWLSIWGHEPDVRSGPVAEAVRAQVKERLVPRGIPLAEGEDVDLASWVEQAARRGSVWRPEADLINCGVVRSSYVLD